MRAFRNFVKPKPRLDEMGMAASRSELELPIPRNMGYFLSFFNEDNLERARVLQWLMTDGLKQASLGRDELRNKINEAVKSQSIPMSRPQVNQPPTSKVAGIGESSINEVIREIRTRYVESVDIFSPEARASNPVFSDPKNMKLVHAHLGMGIDEYYAKYYEPRYIEIAFTRQKAHKYADIQEVNAQLQKLGLEGFKYGGTDGYLQYCEKGDWQEEWERRSIGDRNQQHGPDLSDARDVIAGREKDSVVRFGGDETGGGSNIRREIRRYDDVLLRMRGSFDQWSKKVKQGSEERPEGMEDEEFETIRDLLQANKEISMQERGKGRAGSAKSRFGMMPKTAQEFPVSPDELEELLKYVDLGLRSPIPIGQNQLTPESWNDSWVANMVSDGKKTNLVTLTDDARNTLWEFITKNSKDKKNPHLNINWRWNVIFRKFGVVKDKSAVGYLSKIINSGFKQDPNIQNIQTHQLNVPDLLRIQDTEEFPLTPEFEEKLLYMGYRWTNLSPHEGNSPDWKTRLAGEEGERGDVVMLVFGNEENIIDFVPVMKGKRYPMVQVPVIRGREDQGRVIKNRSMVLGGERVTGGIDLGGIQQNPSEDYDDLEKQLLRGEIGESDSGKTFKNVNDLPSVRYGMNHALSRARTKGYEKFVPKNMQDKNKSVTHADLLAWATEGLWAFSGDQAFQFGYLTDEEFKNILDGWDKEGKNIRRTQKQPTGDPLEDMFGDEEGKGIWDLLRKAGISDPDKQEEYVNRVVKHISDRGNWKDLNALGLPDNVVAAFGANAQKARIRHITNYIFMAIQRKVRLVSREDEKHASEFASEDPESGERRGAEAALEKGVPTSMIKKPSEVMPQLSSPEERRREKGIPLHGKGQPPPQPPEEQQLPKKEDPKPVAPSQPTVPSQPKLAAETIPDLDSLVDPPPTQQQQQPPQQPPQRRVLQRRDTPPIRGMHGDDLLSSLGEHNLWSYVDWRSIWKEMAGTGAVYDGTPPKDGGGFNWWGAVGNPLGVSIKGDANTSKEDPTGKKGKKHGRRKCKR